MHKYPITELIVFENKCKYIYKSDSKPVNPVILFRGQLVMVFIKFKPFYVILVFNKASDVTFAAFDHKIQMV